MAKKILVVDDEADIRETVKQIAEGDGYEVKTASGCEQGLAMLRKEKFDLVLMDFFMPKKSGRTCVEEIRKDSSLKSQKVAFLTVAKPSDSGKGFIEKLKPVDYIQKPFKVEELSKRLKKILK